MDETKPSSYLQDKLEELARLMNDLDAWTYRGNIYIDDHARLGIVKRLNDEGDPVWKPITDERHHPFVIGSNQKGDTA